MKSLENVTTEAVQETKRENIEDEEVPEEQNMPQRGGRQVSRIEPGADWNGDELLQVAMSDVALREDHQEQKEIESYKMSSKPRGICLILNNQDFKKSRTQATKSSKYDDRAGSEIDEKNLVEIFKWMEFDVHVCKDKTKSEMWNIFKEWSAYDHGKYDCFAVCILSHGERTENTDKVLGVDGEGIVLDEIFRLFSGDKCRSLVNKPKLFFLQCRRDRQEDRGVVPEDVVVSDGSSAGAQHKEPVGADFFIGYSTPPGISLYF